MEAGTQSVLILIWALFWMLVLTLMMVHPMFRPARVQLRRSLRLNLNRWNIVRNRIRGRLLRLKGHLLRRLGRALLWLARCLSKEAAAPLWIRLPLRLLGRISIFYLIMHLLFRQAMDAPNVLLYLTVWAALDVEKWWKRRKLRLQGTEAGTNPPVKPAQEQSAKL